MQKKGDQPMASFQLNKDIQVKEKKKGCMLTWAVGAEHAGGHRHAGQPAAAQEAGRHERGGGGQAAPGGKAHPQEQAAGEMLIPCENQVLRQPCSFKVCTVCAVPLCTVQAGSCLTAVPGGKAASQEQAAGEISGPCRDHVPNAARQLPHSCTWWKGTPGPAYPHPKFSASLW